MNIGDAIRTRLSSATAVTNLVSSRIRPLRIRQDETLPAITYEIAGGERYPSMDGASGLVGADVRIHCWTESYSDLQSLADAVRQALDGVSFTASEDVVSVALLETETEQFEPAGDGSDTGTYHGTLDFRIWHNETV